MLSLMMLLLVVGAVDIFQFALEAVATILRETGSIKSMLQRRGVSAAPDVTFEPANMYKRTMKTFADRAPCSCRSVHRRLYC